MGSSFSTFDGPPSLVAGAKQLQRGQLGVAAVLTAELRSIVEEKRQKVQTSARPESKLLHYWA